MLNTPTHSKVIIFITLFINIILQNGQLAQFRGGIRVGITNF